MVWNCLVYAGALLSASPLLRHSLSSSSQSNPFYFPSKVWHNHPFKPAPLNHNRQSCTYKTKWTPSKWRQYRSRRWRCSFKDVDRDIFRVRTSGWLQTHSFRDGNDKTLTKRDDLFRSINNHYWHIILRPVDILTLGISLKCLFIVINATGMSLLLRFVFLVSWFRVLQYFKEFVDGSLCFSLPPSFNHFILWKFYIKKSTTLPYLPSSGVV